MKKLALVACSILLTTFSLEAGMRVFLPQSDRFYLHDETVLTLRPNATGMWYGQHPFQREFAVPVTINSFGFRDVEYSEEKPEEITRLIIIGDSFVEALQVPVEKTFFKVLEKDLEAKSSSERYQVLGFGKSGLGVAEKRTLVEKSLGFDPDMLVLHLNQTDLNDAIALKSTGKETPALFDALLDVSHLARLLVRSLRFSFITRDERLPSLTTPQGQEGEVAWEILAQEIKRIKTTAEQAEVPLLVLLDELLVVRGMCGKEDSLEVRWKGLLQTAEVPLVVLGQDVCALHAEGDPLYFPLDRHWTPRGHQHAAERLFDFLTKEGYQ